MPFEEDNGDLCYVKDCGKGIQMVHSATGLKHRTYNVSSGVATSNAMLRAATEKAIPGAQITLQSGKGPGYRPNAALDLARTTADTGYKPDFNVESGVADYVGWLKAGNAT